MGEKEKLEEARREKPREAEKHGWFTIEEIKKLKSLEPAMKDMLDNFGLG